MNVYRVFYIDFSKSHLTLRMKMTEPKLEDYTLLKVPGTESVVSVTADSLEDLWRQMNVVDGTELPIRLRQRSMMVGDLALDMTAEKAFVCSMVGWTELSAETFRKFREVK